MYIDVKENLRPIGYHQNTCKEMRNLKTDRGPPKLWTSFAGNKKYCPTLICGREEAQHSILYGRCIIVSEKAQMVLCQLVSPADPLVHAFKTGAQSRSKWKRTTAPPASTHHSSSRQYLTSKKLVTGQIERISEAGKVSQHNDNTYHFALPARIRTIPPVRTYIFYTITQQLRKDVQLHLPKDPTAPLHRQSQPACHIKLQADITSSEPSITAV